MSTWTKELVVLSDTSVDVEDGSHMDMVAQTGLF